MCRPVLPPARAGVESASAKPLLPSAYGQFSNYESQILEFESNKFLNKGGGFS